MIVPQLLFMEDTVTGNRQNPIKRESLERGNTQEKLNGSNVIFFSSLLFIVKSKYFRSSIGRALRYERRGWEFKSLREYNSSTHPANDGLSKIQFRTAGSRMLEIMSGCPSGQAKVCKTFYIGSNPILDSVIDARMVEHQLVALE